MTLHLCGLLSVSRAPTPGLLDLAPPAVFRNQVLREACLHAYLALAVESWERGEMFAVYYPKRMLSCCCSYCSVKYCSWSPCCAKFEASFVRMAEPTKVQPQAPRPLRLG